MKILDTVIIIVSTIMTVVCFYIGFYSTEHVATLIWGVSSGLWLCNGIRSALDLLSDK